MTYFCRSLRSRSFAIAIAVTTGLSLVGCGINRLNHIHSDENAEKAKKAQATIETFQSSQQGLLAKVLSNIEAQTTLRRTVADESLRFFNLAALHKIGGEMTWKSLRIELYDDLGVPQWPAFFREEVYLHTDAMLKKADVGERKRDTIILLLAYRLTQLQSEGATVENLPFFNDLNGKLGSLRLEEPDIKVSSLPPRGKLANTLQEFEANEIPSALFPDRSEDEWAKLLTSWRKEASLHLKPEQVKMLFAKSPPANEIIQAIYQEFASFRRDDLNSRFDRRLVHLAAVLKAYEVLVQGERVRAAAYKATQDKFAEDLQQLAAKKPPDGAASPAGKEKAYPNKLVDLLFKFQSVVRSFYKDENRRLKLRLDATSLKARLLEAAAASHDPASVYSLVPIVGSGLNNSDLEELNEYVMHLKTQMDQMKAELQKAKEQQQAVKSKKGDAKGTNAGDDFLKALTELDSLLNKVNTDKLDVTEILKAIQKASAWLELDLDIISSKDQLEVLKTGLDTILKIAATGEADPEMVKGIVNALLSQVGGGDSRFQKAVGEALTDENVKQLQQILADIQQENQEATQRILQFLKSLNGLHQRLHEENVRHYLSLNVIVKQEVVRWKTLQELNADIDVFFDSPQFGERSKNPPKPILFSDKKIIDGWYRLHPPPPNANPKDVAKHPVIDPDASIIGSIRLLAETAALYQNASPQSTDHWNTLRSTDRLRRALQIVQLYELMTAFNRRQAAEDLILLIAEVREHEVQLDQIVVTVVEQEIRLGLGELVAFHSSGITQEDMRLLLTMIQQGLLAWIGTRV
jgi:hypothetical protein